MTLNQAYDSAAAAAFSDRTIEADAVARGYSRHVQVDIGSYVLEGYIRHDADLDGVFTLIDDADGSELAVRGWLASDIEDL